MERTLMCHHHFAHLATYYFAQAHALRCIIEHRAAKGFTNQREEVRMHYARVDHANGLYNLGNYYADLSMSTD